MVNEIIKSAEEKMKKTIEVTKNDFAGLKAGRATPALLDKIQVDYYGTPTPINQLANISVPEARMLIIQPWDKNALSDIEKAIMKSDLDLNPNSDGNIIRLNIPQLTEERRNDLVKIIKKKAEEGRVALRNIRREAIEEMKLAEKEGEISEDDLKRGQETAQKLTDKYVKEIDQVLALKEKDIMQV